MKDYTVEKRHIPSPGGKMKILILRPTTHKMPNTPGILWIHGGGYATGMAEMIYMSRAKNLVKKYGAVVVTPEYRLSGKAPYPAALEDCYAALLYLKEHAGELGCNPGRLMVGGESAGGGLTAALCMYARDLGEVKIAFQMPLYPMLDDRDTESSRDNHGISWNIRRITAKLNNRKSQDGRHKTVPPEKSVLCIIYSSLNRSSSRMTFEKALLYSFLVRPNVVISVLWMTILGDTRLASIAWRFSIFL